MTKQQMVKITVLASLASLILTPIVLAVARATLGAVSPGSIVVGALVATVFFAISGVMAVVTWDDDSFRKPLMRSYVIKAVVLLVTGLVISGTSIDRNAFASSAVCSALVYLAVQAVALSAQISRTTATAPASKGS